MAMLAALMLIGASSLPRTICGRVRADTGGSILSRLTEGVPYSGNFEHYARIVKDRAISRALMARHILATQACTNGHETSELLETGVAPHRETLAADLEARRRVQPTLEVMAGYSVSVARGPGRKVWTAFRDLGDATRGIAPGEVLTTVARPQVGKSVIASQILIKAAVEGKPCVFLSLEMPREQALSESP